MHKQSQILSLNLRFLIIYLLEISFALALVVYRKWCIPEVTGFVLFSYQLPLFWRQCRRLQRLVDRVGAAERVVEAVHLLEALVALLVDALALRHLVEHRWLWLRVVFHELHVLEDWRVEID